VSLTFNGKKFIWVKEEKFSERKIIFYDASESKLGMIERIGLKKKHCINCKLTENDNFSHFQAVSPKREIYRKIYDLKF
jgi:hypothetical protein